VVGPVFFIGEPGEVVDIFLEVMKGFDRDAGRRNGGVGGVRRSAGPHLSGGSNDIIFGDGDTYVIIPEFAIEFALVEIRDGVPAFAVVHGRLGVPLGDLVGIADVSTPGEVEGQLFMKRGGDKGRSTGREGMWKDNFYDIDIAGMVFHAGCFSVDAEVQPVDIAFPIFIGKVEIRMAVFQHLLAECRPVILVSVGPAMYPDPWEGVGGVVGVLHFDEAIQGMLHIVEADVDDIIYFLLPVLLSYEL
jgi:hypothetical protein